MEFGNWFLAILVVPLILRRTILFPPVYFIVLAKSVEILSILIVLTEVSQFLNKANHAGYTG